MLSTYLNDHLAGATAGLELARRSRTANRGNRYGDYLDALAGEIERDRDTLLEVMRRLDIGVDHAKQVVAWLAEKLGRLKPNGRVVGYSPLSRLVELELLALGVEGKRALWRSLDRAVGEDPRLAGIDFAELGRRAQAQRRQLEGRRLRAAGEAFAPRASHEPAR